MRPQTQPVPTAQNFVFQIFQTLTAKSFTQILIIYFWFPPTSQYNKKKKSVDVLRKLGALVFAPFLTSINPGRVNTQFPPIQWR